MPFKTKKHKIAAGKHRVVISESGKISWTGKADDSSTAGGKKHYSASSESSIDKLGVKKELLHTGVLAGIIIGLQLALRILNLPFVS